MGQAAGRDKKGAGGLAMKMFAVDIHLGYRCNNNCVHCIVAGVREKLIREGKPTDRTTDEIKDIIDKAARDGADKISFTGGETTIRPDFAELLSYVKEKGIKLGLQTNGRAFSMQEFADKVMDIAPDMNIEIAVHHADPKMHDNVTRVSGSARQTTEGIKNLRDRGAKINLKTVVTRFNYKDLKDLVQMASGLGIGQFDIVYPHGLGNARKYWEDIVVPYTGIIRYVTDAIDEGEKTGVHVMLEGIPFCFLEGYEDHARENRMKVLESEGSRKDLCFLVSGQSDWKDARQGMKSKPEACRTCRYFDACEGPWEEYPELNGADEFVPVKRK